VGTEVGRRGGKGQRIQITYKTLRIINENWAIRLERSNSFSLEGVDGTANGKSKNPAVQIMKIEQSEPVYRLIVALSWG
jgi:hypothetical protein